MAEVTKKTKEWRVLKGPDTAQIGSTRVSFYRGAPGPFRIHVRGSSFTAAGARELSRVLIIAAETDEAESRARGAGKL